MSRLGLLANPWAALAMRLYLGGVFVYASIYKINFAAEFAETVASYQIVPELLVNPMAVVLPWLELVAGLLLVVGLRVKAAALVINFLLAVFSLAIAVTLFRDIPIGCGCFSTLDPAMGWTALLRDLVWLGMGTYVYAYDRKFQLERNFLVRVKES
ncbi:MAG TPA: DoxX family protein [Desulfovibrio sp.]|nr:DoxX family protein [Desulfovibrio sp.]